jgi:DNA (cytosine-5)-methyltransferase 1
MIRIATVFSGIGSVEHALVRMGIPHEIVFAADIDKFARETYKANFEIKDDVFFEDVCAIDWKKFRGQVDLFVGWSPCQSFSMVGKRKWLSDDRGNLIYQYIRLVDEIQPKVFIFENVKWLLNHDWWKTFDKVLKAFDSLWYKFDKQVLNAKDYGIPQHRERVMLVWFKDEKMFKNFSFPEKVPLWITMKDLLENNPDSKYYLGDKWVSFVTKEKNIKKRYTQINGDIALCQKANQQFNRHWDFIKEECKEDVDQKYYLSEKVKKYVLSSWTKNFYSKPEIDLDVARPLLQSMHKMHRAWVDNYISKWDKIRKLTPRECLRLMWFSDDFKIVVSDTQMYKQAGNSIVVNIFFHLLPKIWILNSFSLKKYTHESIQINTMKKIWI